MRLPHILVAFRAACAPVIVLLAYQRASGLLLAAILYAALASDVFDGVIARRLGIATPALRRADTLVDTTFYAAAAIALVLTAPDAFVQVEMLLFLFVNIHVARAVFEVTKYGRKASYHMWSAKTFGLLLSAAFGYGFVSGHTNMLLPLALSVGIWNELEGLFVSFFLTSWRCDVPSVVHALRVVER
jgi:phosphatidylglycerophosphate synthase